MEAWEKLSSEEKLGLSLLYYYKNIYQKVLLVLQMHSRIDSMHAVFQSRKASFYI